MCVCRYCYNYDVQQRLLEIDGAHAAIISSLKQLMEAFTPLAVCFLFHPPVPYHHRDAMSMWMCMRVQEAGGAARRDIFLADWMEMSVHELVGPLHVKQFLYDICVC